MGHPKMATATEPNFKDRLLAEERFGEFEIYLGMLRKKPFMLMGQAAIIHTLDRFPPVGAAAAEHSRAAKLRLEDRKAFLAYEEQRKQHKRDLDKRSYEKKTQPGTVKTISDKSIREEMLILSHRTQHDKPNMDRDLEWAYTRMGMPGIRPLEAPSVPAYHLWRLTHKDANKFLSQFTSRQESNRKASGGSDREKEADRTEKIKAIDKLLEVLTPDIEGLLLEAEELYPDEVQRVLTDLGYHTDVSAEECTTEFAVPQTGTEAGVCGPEVRTGDAVGMCDGPPAVL